MRLASFIPKGGSEIRIGAVYDEKESLLDLNAAYALYLKEHEGEELPNRFADGALPSDMIDFLKTGEKGMERAKKSITFFRKKNGTEKTLDPAGRRILHRASEVKLKVPVPNPPEILYMAFTSRGVYEDARKAGTWVPKESPILPVWFLKSHESLTDPDGCVIIPAGSRAVMPSAELGVVIGKRAFRISPEEVYDYIAGYTIGHDVTVADFFPLEHVTYCMGRNKSFVTFAPIGPYIATKEDIPDPHNLQIDTYVDNQLCLSVNTNLYERKLEELIPFIAMHEPLPVGTILMMGGPPGVPNVTVPPGQTWASTIKGVGTLRNVIISDEEAVAKGLVPRPYHWPGEISYWYRETPTGPQIWTVKPKEHD